MDDEVHAAFVGRGTDLLEEIDQMVAEPFGIDVPVAQELLAELVEGKALFRPGQSGQDVAGELFLFRLAHFVEAEAGPLFFFVGIFPVGRGAFQDKQVEGYQGGAFETERPRMVGQEVGQVGAGPVEDGHEIVGDAPDAAGCQVPQGLPVVLDIGPERSGLCLDMFMHGDAFDHAPGQAGFGNQGLPPADFFDGPYFPVGDMVQGVYDIGRSGLPDIPQGNRVGRTVPTPRLSHQIHKQSELNGKGFKTSVDDRDGSGYEARSVAGKPLEGAEQVFRFPETVEGGMGKYGFRAGRERPVGIGQ